MTLIRFKEKDEEKQKIFIRWRHQILSINNLSSTHYKPLKSFNNSQLHKFILCVKTKTKKKTKFVFKVKSRIITFNFVSNTPLHLRCMDSNRT